jgi:hypothetical protein
MENAFVIIQVLNLTLLRDQTAIAAPWLERRSLSPSPKFMRRDILDLDLPSPVMLTPDQLDALRQKSLDGLLSSRTAFLTLKLGMCLIPHTRSFELAALSSRRLGSSL